MRGARHGISFSGLSAALRAGAVTVPTYSREDEAPRGSVPCRGSHGCNVEERDLNPGPLVLGSMPLTATLRGVGGRLTGALARDFTEKKKKKAVFRLKMPVSSPRSQLPTATWTEEKQRINKCVSLAAARASVAGDARGPAPLGRRPFPRSRWKNRH